MDDYTRRMLRDYDWSMAQPNPPAPPDRTPACTCTDPECSDPVHQMPADAPEPDPDDAEAQRIAEVFADARAEQDRGL